MEIISLKNRLLKHKFLYWLLRPLYKFVKYLINKILEKKLVRLERYVDTKDFSFNHRGLLTKQNSDFMREPDFISAFQKGLRQYEDFYGGKDKKKNRSYWERHVVLWAAHHAAKLAGDFVECGVSSGIASMSVVSYLDFNKLTGRKFYLFDTFNGLDKRFATEKEYKKYEHAYLDSYEFVKESFKEYPNVILVRGSIPLTLSRAKIAKVAYLHIDMNCVIPEKEAIKYFWPKLVPGAIVILDDYGLASHKEQKKAMDEFAFLEKVKILSLPTGQGMIIK